ncbi:MAG: hypothetical protein CXT78_12670 [Thaumarchaeota archaeon]|jgi:uncharacterized membrane protein|nr:MAG: hypothetical protein CXT78_12670 [Nitrososphaerota archaeon]
MSIVTKMQIIAFVIIIVMGAIILDRDSFGIFLVIMFVLVAGLMVKHLYKDHKQKKQLEENKDGND